MLDIGPALLPCLPDNLGSGLHSHACLPCSLAGGWWDRPWLARPYPAGHRIPPSSQILSLMEQLALMSQKRTPLVSISRILKQSQRKNLSYICHRYFKGLFVNTTEFVNSTEHPRSHGCRVFHQAVISPTSLPFTVT